MQTLTSMFWIQLSAVSCDNVVSCAVKQAEVETVAL